VLQVKQLTRDELLYKNMVCNRCILVVNQFFEKLAFLPLRIALGEVESSGEMQPEDLTKRGIGSSTMVLNL
jgi:hypothetical protein